MKRYLIIDDGDIIGGGQLFALRLGDHLRRHVTDAAATIVCPETGQLPERSSRLGLETVFADLPPLALQSGPAIPRAVAAVRRLLVRRAQGAVVVCNSPRASAYVAAAAETLADQLTVVHLLHEQETAARPSARFVLRRFGAPVVVGSNAAQVYEERLPGVPVRRVNNFLGWEELESFVERRPQPSPAAGPPTLGLLGRWIPEKGIVELLDELVEVDGAWSSLLIGAASEDDNYERRARDRITRLGLDGRVELRGFVEDIGAFFRSIDALAVPSIGNEAQPTVILEALAHGCPCLVREPLWSRDFEGLPVLSYRTAEALAAALTALPTDQASADTLRLRFGPDQALAGIDAAAITARSRPGLLRRRARPASSE